MRHVPLLVMEGDATTGAAHRRYARVTHGLRCRTGRVKEVGPGTAGCPTAGGPAWAAVPRAEGAAGRGLPTAVTRGGATSGHGLPSTLDVGHRGALRVAWRYVAAVCICALVLCPQEQTRNHRNDQRRSAGWLTALKGATHGHWNREVVQQRKGLRLHRTRRRRT